MLIFLHNGTILAVIVAVGGYRHGGIVGAGTLGISLGVALRVMADASPGLGVRVGASAGPDRGTGDRPATFRLGAIIAGILGTRGEDSCGAFGESEGAAAGRAVAWLTRSRVIAYNENPFEAAATIDRKTQRRPRVSEGRNEPIDARTCLRRVSACADLW